MQVSTSNSGRSAGVANRTPLAASVGTRNADARLTSAPLSRAVGARTAGDGGPDDHFYNINADLAAGPLARALDADALVFLTDVPGVLDADGARCASLSHRACFEMKRSGVIRGGMIPKVEAALAALDQHPSMLVKIAPAEAADCVLVALDDSVGTRFIEED